VTISVIIPTRNRLKYLISAIASVQAQSYKDWEAVVVDDASSDGTPDWLASLGDERVRVTRSSKHRERSAARNAGLQEARGELVMFLDDDDRLEPHAFSYLSASLEHHPDAIAAVGARSYFDERGEGMKFRMSLWPVKRVIWPEVLFAFVPAQGEALIRKAAVVQAGCWDENLAAAEDHKIWLRLASLGPMVILPDTVLHIRVHPTRTQFRGVRRAELGLRAEFVRALPVALQHLGTSALSARRSALAGAAFYRRAHFWKALACYLSAAGNAPRLLFSPLAGPYLLALLAKSLVGAILGRSGVKLAGRLKSGMRSRKSKSSHENMSPQSTAARSPAHVQGCARHD
jgi:glycosyltransferase involved in cell wall biosynthesis